MELVGGEARVALVEKSEQGLKLLAVRRLGAGEELSRVLRTLPRRPSSGACAVSLEHSAVRILSLPPATEENLDRIVALEAETALPIPAEEMALAHHPLGMTEQSRLEILLAAARLSAVQETLRAAVGGTSLSMAVSVTPIALLNALGQAQARETACAVLRVEAGGSELLVVERGRLVLAQPIPAGCAAAVEAVEARELVTAGGGAGLGTPAPAWTAVLSQQLRYVLQALAYERGLSVERLYLCGAGALEPQAGWHLSEALDLPVAAFPVPEAGGAEGPVFAVAYGCAVQAAGAAAVALNLTPVRVTVAREQLERRQVTFSWSALVASLVIAGGLVFAAALHQRTAEAEEAEAQLQRLRSSVGAVPAAPAELKEAAKAIGEVVKAPATAAGTLAMLSQQLPPGVWLAELTYNRQTGAIIRGFSTREDGPARAQIALINRHLYENVGLDYRTQQEIAGVPVWGFQITCKLPQERQGRR
jgi:Tfp pilus assembly protein PilN